MVPSLSSRLRRRASVNAAWIAVLLLVGCDNVYPEVVVVNQTDERVLMSNISFNGCLWNVVLAYGEATPPQRCLPGSDRIHFKKFDAGKYCTEQAQDGGLQGVCPCDGGTPQPTGSSEPGLTQTEPLWFNYQTVEDHQVQYGEFHKFEVRSGDIEQDFSTPGPYGH